MENGFDDKTKSTGNENEQPIKKNPVNFSWADPTDKKVAVNGNNSYFHEYLVDQIINDLQEECGMTYENATRMIHTQGLKIYSTLDSTAQAVVTKEFADSDNFPSISGIRNQ